MTLRPSIQSLLDELEQVRIKTAKLLADRDEMLRELAQLSGRQMDLKAQLDQERAKLKRRGWAD